jgi:uncharacterized protein YvpB
MRFNDGRMNARRFSIPFRLALVSGGLWLAATGCAAAPVSHASADALEPSPTAAALLPPTAPSPAPTLEVVSAVVPEAPTPTAPPAATATLWPTLSPAPFVPISSLVETASIADITGHSQTLSLSCEARAAADWAGYFGVAIDELTFLSQLPVSDDPDVGFVGDVRGEWGQIPPNAYGVHAWPVASLLHDYGLRARSRHYMSVEDLRGEIAAGRPVIVWVVGHVDGVGERVRYRASSGRETIVAPFEHVVIAVGYTADTITVLDGARRYDRPLETFVNSWALLGNMTIIYTGP